MKNDVVESYREWLADFQWNWFATLTFRNTVSEPAAKASFKKWMMDLSRTYPSVVAFCVREGAEDRERIHFHALIAGVKGADMRRWTQRWGQLAGHAKVLAFRGKDANNAIGYLLKTISASSTDQIEIFAADKECNDPRGQSTPEGTRGCGISAGQHRNSLPLHLRKKDTSYTAEQEMRKVPTLGPSGVASQSDPSGRIEKLVVRRRVDSGFHVERRGKLLVMVIPLTSPRPSKSSGKTNVIGSTGGPRATFAKDENGYPIIVNAIAMVNPFRSIVKQRADAVLARWEGRLT